MSEKEQIEIANIIKNCFIEESRKESNKMYKWQELPVFDSVISSLAEALSNAGYHKTTWHKVADGDKGMTGMTGMEALNAICAECQQDKGKIQVACPWRSISGDYCEEYETIKRCLERLAELEDKIENGTLIELPCKVGTIVYTIYKEDWTAEYTILASRVKGFSDYGDGLGLRFVLPFGSPAVSLLGDRVFLTHSKAEKKLKELKGEE